MGLRISKPIFLPSPHSGEVLRRDGFGEPDAVDGAEESIAVGGHAGGADLVDAGPAVSCADLAGGVIIPGQVDVQPGLGMRPRASMEETNFSPVPW